jgi:hypothetical protein
MNNELDFYIPTRKNDLKDEKWIELMKLNKDF